MKLFIAVIVAIGLFSAAEFVHAAPRGPGNGTEGTISTVGSNGFAMTTKDGKTLDVLCSANTKFQSSGEAADPSEIKVGVHVGVMGGINSPTQITATIVNILPAKGKKK